MVLIVHKRNEDSKFLYQAPASSSNDDVVRELATMHNLRMKIRRAATAVQELAQFGVIKPPELAGLSDETERLAAELHQMPLPSEPSTASAAGMFVPPEGHVIRRDPSARRVGVAPSDHVATVMNKTAEDALALTDKSQVDKGFVLTHQALTEAFDSLKGACMIAYPMGLPEYEPIRMIIENTEDPATLGSADILDPETAQLWWAAKELSRDKLLQDFVGRNEKTKIIAKLQKKGAGAPAKEAPLDSEGQKNMLSFYHKRQEELKKLEEDAEDAYTNSSWADPRGLKKAFLGMNDIKWGPGGR